MNSYGAVAAGRRSRGPVTLGGARLQGGRPWTAVDASPCFSRDGGLGPERRDRMVWNSGAPEVRIEAGVGLRLPPSAAARASSRVPPPGQAWREGADRNRR